MCRKIREWSKLIETKQPSDQKTEDPALEEALEAYRAKVNERYMWAKPYLYLAVRGGTEVLLPKPNPFNCENNYHELNADPTRRDNLILNAFAEDGYQYCQDISWTYQTTTNGYIIPQSRRELQLDFRPNVFFWFVAFDDGSIWFYPESLIQFCQQHQSEPRSFFVEPEPEPQPQPQPEPQPEPAAPPPSPFEEAVQAKYRLRPQDILWAKPYSSKTVDGDTTMLLPIPRLSRLDKEIMEAEPCKRDKFVMDSFNKSYLQGSFCLYDSWHYNQLQKAYLIPNSRREVFIDILNEPLVFWFVSWQDGTVWFCPESLIQFCLDHEQ